MLDKKAWYQEQGSGDGKGNGKLCMHIPYESMGLGQRIERDIKY